MNSAPTLYSYCVAYDQGVAPNPYGGICTLGICKPRIRASAKVGDWIVGTSSHKTGSNFNMVYAMKVSQKMSFKDYDLFCKKQLTTKIPKTNSKAYAERQGDCIYAFEQSEDDPQMRANENHSIDHMNHDLNGKNVLLSNQYYYFGSNAKELPTELWGIVKKGPGHKSASNTPYIDPFINWIKNVVEKEHGIGIHGDPFLMPQGEKKFKENQKTLSGCGGL